MTNDPVNTERGQSILVVDDDASVRRVLTALLEQGGYEVRGVGSGEEALAALDAGCFDLVISDLRMRGMDGMALLGAVVTRHPGLPVMMLTAHGTVPLAVAAMRSGAADFLLKPFDREEILFVVDKALRASKTNRDAPPLPALHGGGIIGRAPALLEVLQVIRRAATGTATVLIRGESGTGKELAARALHDASPRRDGPFVSLHCAALPESLLESELFGYEKGAFTGAVARKPGRVELADGGTLFLDEIGDIPPGTQVKLLRVLQERTFERLGSTRTEKVDVRFVAATHRDLESMAAEGTFREDLFYRLNVVPVWMPPLRERREDIDTLVRHFCSTLARANGRASMAITEEAVALLRTEPWRGNVRELANFVERLVVLSPSDTIDAEHTARELARVPVAKRAPLGALEAGAHSGASPLAALEARRRDGEREEILNALTRAADNRALASRLLGVSRRTLYNKLREHGLS